MGKEKIKTGDIFKINLSINLHGYGQVIEVFKNHLTIVFYKKTYKNGLDYSITNILNDEILFFYNTFDGFFKLKKWVVIDNDLTPLKRIVLPFYLINTPTGEIVEDFHGNKIRQSTAKDCENIDYKGFVAPINFEEAFYDYHNIAKAEDDYRDLFYTNVLKSRS